MIESRAAPTGEAIVPRVRAFGRPGSGIRLAADRLAACLRAIGASA